MLTAAAGWQGTANNLAGTGQDFARIISQIPWSGPSSESMRATAASYATWLFATAEQAAQTAALAHAAATAYELARATAIPPEAVTCNRMQLAILTATNILGMNSVAIAATESQYAEMWTQDIAAMTAYSATSAELTSALPNWTTPPAATAPPSAPAIWTYLLGGQTIPQLFWTTFQANLSSGPFSLPLQLLSLFTVLWATGSPDSPINQILGLAQNPVIAPPTYLAEPLATAPTPQIRANMGSGNTLGPLRVPPTWAQPPKQLVPRPITVNTVGSELEPYPLGLPILTGSGGTTTRKPLPEYGKSSTVMVKHPYGG